MKKHERITRFYDSMRRLGFTFDEIETLRRAQLTLHRWAERECNGEIERDEQTGKTYSVYDNGRTMVRYRTADRETGALKRIEQVRRDRNSRVWIQSGETGEYHPERGNKATDVHFHHQTDPRGCALYIIRPGDVPEGADPSAFYSRGIAVCI